MANKLLFAVLFCTLQLGIDPIFVFNNSVAPKKLTLKIIDCNAPAPDSFHINISGSDLVSLGWMPVWMGAIHTLEVSKKVSDNWVVLFTDYNVPGDSYLFSDLDPGYYKARIATNCSTGVTSLNVRELFFEFKIIDLSTAGRIPKNPVSRGECSEIDYLSHEWVGFQVREIGTENSNLFEIELPVGPYYASALVKRVHDNPIVAVNEDGQFPVSGGPLKKVISPFRMDDKSKPQPTIGYIIFNRNADINHPPIIFLCKDTDNITQSWKSEYEFTIMTAEDVIVDYPAPPGINTDKSILDTIIYSGYKAQSPFKESLNLFVSSIDSECGKTIFRLFNTNGQVVLLYEADLHNSHICLPVATVLPGIYLLHIKNDCETETIKVIKSE